MTQMTQMKEMRTTRLEARDSQETRPGTLDAIERHMPPSVYQRDPQTFAIIGAGIAVHRELGCGFLEPAYRRPLEMELAARQVPYRVEPSFRIVYKGVDTGVVYRPDFVCFGEIIVELKAVKQLSAVDEAQAINYLKVSGLKRALLLNFGAT